MSSTSYTMTPGCEKIIQTGRPKASAVELKKSCMWPPSKLRTKFNKCIDGSVVADDSWEIFKIKRVFYETDNLAKAREKAKQAEIESEINSDDNDKSARQRKKTRKIYDSDTSPDDSDEKNIPYPTPPATKIDTNTSKTSSMWRASTGDNYKFNKQVQPARKVWSSTSTSTEGEGIAEVSVQTLGSLDLTVTPFLKETPNSQALDVIAKHLASIQTDIRELQISQQEILQRVRSCSSTPLEHSLPDGITLPCDDNEALIIIETWITAKAENKKLLVTYLGLVGGNKIPVIIRRILEKLFTNKLAVLCNWTGKNRKIPLKDLDLMNIIRDAVRQNQIAAKATDAEINEVISNWFRFTKDRNGGREARRVKQ